MKRLVLLLLPLVMASMSWSQTPPPGTISRPRSTVTNPSGVPEVTSSPEQGNLTFTNNAGETFTVAQLTAQLQNLRQTVDQTLPMLQAFTENFSNSITGGQGGISGAISDILRGLRRNSSQTASTTSTNQLLAALQGLLSTNAPGTSPSNANTLLDLSRLQNDLQPVVSVLQDLRISGETTNTSAATPQYPNRGLTPTGR